MLGFLTDPAAIFFNISADRSISCIHIFVYVTVVNDYTPILTEYSSGRVLTHQNEIIKYGRRKLSVLRFFGASSVSAIQCVILILFLLLYFTPHNLFQKAYSDGLSQENLPPATVGNRKASLFIKVSPPVLTTETKGNAFIQVRLFDANNNQTIQHVTYEITITKGIPRLQEKSPYCEIFFMHTMDF